MLLHDNIHVITCTLLINLIPLYNMYTDGFSMFKSSTTHWCVARLQSIEMLSSLENTHTRIYISDSVYFHLITYSYTIILLILIMTLDKNNSIKSAFVIASPGIVPYGGSLYET